MRYWYLWKGQINKLWYIYIILFFIWGIVSYRKLFLARLGGQACNPSYLTGWGRRIESLSSTWAVSVEWVQGLPELLTEMVSKQKVKRWLRVQVNVRVPAYHVRSCRFNPQNFRKFKKKGLIPYWFIKHLQKPLFSARSCVEQSVS